MSLESTELDRCPSLGGETLMPDSKPCTLNPKSHTGPGDGRP